MNSLRRVLSGNLNRLRLIGREIGNIGSGANQGSGNSTGPPLGKMQVAKEEEYFYKKRKEQLEKLKDSKYKVDIQEEEVTKHQNSAEPPNKS